LRRFLLLGIVFSTVEQNHRLWRVREDGTVPRTLTFSPSYGRGEAAELLKVLSNAILVQLRQVTELESRKR
jgi:hypothetical protein